MAPTTIGTTATPVHLAGDLEAPLDERAREGQVARVAGGIGEGARDRGGHPGLGGPAGLDQDEGLLLETARPEPPGAPAELGVDDAVDEGRLALRLDLVRHHQPALAGL